MSAALEQAARGPGHFHGEIQGDRVHLLGFDNRLLRPAIYARGLDIVRIAHAPDSTAVRCLLLVCDTTARAGRKTAKSAYTSAELTKALALRGKQDPVHILQAHWKWVSARLPAHTVTLEVDPFDDATGECYADVEFTATPVDDMRVGFLGSRALGRYALKDGDVDGLSLSVGAYSAAKAWRRCLRDGLDADWRRGKQLWLAVVQSLVDGKSSQIPFFSTEHLRGLLSGPGAAAAFADFCQCLMQDSGASAEQPAGLRWTVVHGGGLEAAAAARAGNREPVEVHARVDQVAAKAAPVRTGRIPGHVVVSSVSGAVVAANLPESIAEVVRRVAREVAPHMETVSAKEFSSALRTDSLARLAVRLAEKHSPEGCAEVERVCLAEAGLSQYPADRQGQPRWIQLTGSQIVGVVVERAWHDAEQKLGWMRDAASGVILGLPARRIRAGA